MQQEGKPTFLKNHEARVRGVAFSPMDRYLFCSGAYDGKVNLYSALRMELLVSCQIYPMTKARHINAVRFTSDGFNILAATTAGRLAVVDVESGEQFQTYDDCTYSSGRDRTALAADPLFPSIAVSVSVNGKGITLLDLRMPLPLDCFYHLHESVIHDLVFMHQSWPWARGQMSTLLTAGGEGSCRVCTLDGRVLHIFHPSHQNINTVCPTPESFNVGTDGFCSVIMSGGDKMSSYVPNIGIGEHLNDHAMQIWKLRYTSNGGQLYSACDEGLVRRYRRYPDHHQYLGEVYEHNGDIQDLDISLYDEYIITASSDKSVGVFKIGDPSHGCTEYSELT